MVGMDIGSSKLNWKTIPPPEFAWVMVTDRTGKLNPNFADQWSQLAKRGIPRGAYHSCIPSRFSNPVSDARKVWRLVGAIKGEDQVASRVLTTEMRDIETVRWLGRHYEALCSLYPEHAYLVTTPEFLESLGNLRNLASASCWLVGETLDFPQWQSVGTAASVVTEPVPS